MRRSSRASVALGVLVTAALTVGCASASTPQPVQRRPAAKATCARPELTSLPAGVEPRDRELVPLSSTLLGVESTFDDGEQRSVLVIAGGYLDDVLEAYDDLETIDWQRVDGSRATVLGGDFLDRTVRAVYWRDTAASPPCDVRAIIATNVDDRTFTRMLAGVR